LPLQSKNVFSSANRLGGFHAGSLNKGAIEKNRSRATPNSHATLPTVCHYLDNQHTNQNSNQTKNTANYSSPKKK